MPDQFNYNQYDPQTQRALATGLARNQSGRRPTYAVTNQIHSAEAARQGKWMLAMQELGLRNKSANMQHAQAMAGLAAQNRGLDLKAQNLNFNKGAFKDWAGDQKKAQLIGLLSGLGGAAYSAYEGHRRKKDLAQQNALASELVRLQMVGLRSAEQGTEAARAGIPLRYLYGPGGR